MGRHGQKAPSVPHAYHRRSILDQIDDAWFNGQRLLEPDTLYIKEGAFFAALREIRFADRGTPGGSRYETAPNFSRYGPCEVVRVPNDDPYILRGSFRFVKGEARRA